MIIRKIYTQGGLWLKVLSWSRDNLLIQWHGVESRGINSVGSYSFVVINQIKKAKREIEFNVGLVNFSYPYLSCLLSTVA